MTITEIKLNSPFHDDCQATFNCHFNNSLNDEAYDIIRIIRFISHDYSDLENILANNPDAVKTFDNLKNLLNEFNKWIEENKSAIKQSRNRQASNDLIRYLMLLIYNRAVLDPDKLNHYEPFSPQVYGETSFDLIEKMLKRVKLNENDVFMDLGSGVGNVVLQVAALNSCKRCYGFEKAEWPAYYAFKMEKEFKFWMKFFDKSYSDFNLYKADFLSDEEYIDETRTKTMNEYVKEIINESNLIFVNNYAFGAEVDHQLKLRFCNMLEGAIIVSSKPFCSLNFRINPRNLNDIGTMLNIDFEPPLNGQVSWTDKPINYYFHKIDRTLLEKYFESKKNPTIEIESHKCKHSKSHSPSSVSSTSSLSPSTSPSSSPSSSSSTSSHKKKSRKLNDDDTGEPARRVRKKKRKQSPTSEINKTQTNSLLCKKRAKLIKNKTKLLNKDHLNTLNKMHSEVCHKLKKQHTKFNDPTMTSLKDENLSKQLLKDCKISPKIIPKKQVCDLGDDVNEAIDLYLKKLKKHYVDYLTYMKNGTEFQDKIKQEIKQESKKKANNLYQIEKWEKKINDVLKQDVMLLKQRAEEVGISCLESPQQLMDHARQMLENHHKLIEKMNKIQNEINSLEIKPTDLKPTQFNTSNIRLKNTFDSLKKLSSYFNTDQKLDLSNLIKNSTEECFNQRNSEVRSVESNPSTDETLTATEKGDDEMDDDDLDYLNDEEIKDTNKKLKNNKPKPAVNTQQQVSPVVKYEKLLDQDTTNQNWRSFKIPKKSNCDETQKAQGPHTPPGSPTLSTSSTSSSANSLQTNSTSAINTETQKYSSLNENQAIQSNYDSFNQQQYQQKQSNYYHPKKNQFRQYMMENSTGPSSYSDQSHLNKY